MINIGTSKIYPWGWRLSLGLCMVPATTLLLGGIFLDDTPNSLCERGHPEEVQRNMFSLECALMEAHTSTEHRARKPSDDAASCQLSIPQRLSAGGTALL